MLVLFMFSFRHYINKGPNRPNSLIVLKFLFDHCCVMYCFFLSFCL